MCLKVHSYSRISNFSIPNKNEKLITRCASCLSVSK